MVRKLNYCQRLSEARLNTELENDNHQSKRISPGHGMLPAILSCNFLYLLPDHF
jgi:hypothetical protein